MLTALLFSQMQAEEQYGLNGFIYVGYVKLTAIASPQIY